VLLSSDRHLAFAQRTLILFKDTTLSDPVGLEADGLLTRITFSVDVVPRDIQFHLSPTSGIQKRASIPVDAPL